MPTSLVSEFSFAAATFQPAPCSVSAMLSAARNVVLPLLGAPHIAIFGTSGSFLVDQRERHVLRSAEEADVRREAGHLYDAQRFTGLPAEPLPDLPARALVGQHAEADVRHGAQLLQR